MEISMRRVRVREDRSVTARFEPNLDLDDYCDIIESRGTELAGLLRPTAHSQAPDRRAERACDRVTLIAGELARAAGAREIDTLGEVEHIAGQVAAALRAGNAALPVTWLTSEPASTAWARRLAHATTITALDVGDALQTTIEVDEDVALDGVDEIVICLLPRLHPLVLLYDDYHSVDPNRLAMEIASLADGAGWTLRADEEEGITTERGAYGVARRTIEGSALDLYRALWNRGPLPGDSPWLTARWQRVRFPVEELRQPHPGSLDERLGRAYRFYAQLQRAGLDGEELASELSWFEWSSSTVIDRTVAHRDVLPLLDELVAQGVGDSEFLSWLGAGPIEDVLRDPDVRWSAAMAMEIEDRARRDSAWDEAVRSVWCTPEDVARLPRGLQERVVELPPSPERVTARRRARVPSRSARPRWRRG
jgi:hypothetical protein